MPALAALAAFAPLPVLHPVALAGLEAAGIAGYAAFVLVVLRLSVAWAEAATGARAEASEEPPPTGTVGESPSAPGRSGRS